MGVPFVDLSVIHDPIRPQILAAMADVFERERYILGPDVASFEAEIAAFLGAEHAVGVSSGTDAVLLALMALATTASATRTYGDHDETWDEVLPPPPRTWYLLVAPENRPTLCRWA